MEGEIILKVSSTDFASEIYTIVFNGGGYEEILNYILSLSTEDRDELINEGVEAIIAALETYDGLAEYVNIILPMLGI